MKNWLVSDNYWNELLLIASIILLQLTPRFRKNIPLLDEVCDGATFSNYYYINFTIYVSFYTQGSTITDLDINSDSFKDSNLAVSTIDSQHTSKKEGAK